MAVYTKLFAEGAETAGFNADVFTCPSDGHTYVVRSCSLWSNSVGGGTANLLVLNAGGLFSVTTTLQYAAFTNELRYVLSPGDKIYLYLPVGSWGYGISGYDLF